MELTPTLVSWITRRFPISEMHLGTFTDSMEIQCWKVNFKTQVFSKTADPHLTMHWIKEVETAKSIDELLTSRSNVGRTDFPDYDMLDAMIASALKELLNRHVRGGGTHVRQYVDVSGAREKRRRRTNSSKQRRPAGQPQARRTKNRKSMAD